MSKFRQPLAPQPFEAAGYTFHPVKELGPNLWLMRLAGGLELHDAATLAADTLDAATAIAGDPRVAEVSENARIPYAEPPPTDPLYPAQRWNYDTAIRLPLAWDITTGRNNVRIAILDSGRTEHPDLSWGPGKDFIGFDDDPTATGTYHHGIHVAGVIGAIPNNGKGGAGVCWGCTILPLRTGDTQGNVDSAIADALYWAGGQISPGQNGPRRADVVNLSASDKRSCSHHTAFAIRDAINFAVGQGVVVVVAAGNFGGTYDAQFPANCDNTIAVAASAPGGKRAAYSTRGSKVDITAPGSERTQYTPPGGDLPKLSFWGEDIDVPCPRYVTAFDDPWTGTLGVVSTWTAATATPGPGDHCYRYLTGTSVAAPHVSGVIGLMLSLNPGLTPAQIEQMLKTTARPMSSTDCPQGGCGAGMLDAYAAVQAARVLAVSPESLAFGDVGVGSLLDRTITVTNRGTAPLTLTGVLPSSAAFTVVSPLPGPIPAGASVNLTVRCAPSAAVSYSGTLAISSTGGPASVTLSCRGLAPVISVPASLAFGDVPVGTSPGRLVAITNTGTAPLTVSSFGLGGGPFSPVVPQMPLTIAPGGFTNFEVRCTPPYHSTYTGTLSFISNGGEASVSLSCRGYAAEIRATEWLVFGDVRVGETADRPLTVHNIGTAPLTVSGASVPNAAFSIIGALPGPIAPGSSADFTVRCRPSSAESYSGSLMLSSNGGPWPTGLTCRGVAPILSVSPTRLDD